MSLTMRRFLAALAFACALLAAGSARAWNSGTHVYVAERLLRGQASNPRLVIDADYGASALDLFGNDFTSPGWELNQLLHDPTGTLFMNVWDAASGLRERGFAYGLVSHNNAWGADATAHISGLTSGQGVGWVTARGEVLGSMLDPYLQEAGIFLSSSPEAASQLILGYEAGLREYLRDYGWALMQPNAVDLLASQTATIAEGYLGLPPGSASPLVPLIEFGILAGMQLCAPDYQQEIAATVEWVGANLTAAGVTY